MRAKEAAAASAVKKPKNRIVREKNMSGARSTGSAGGVGDVRSASDARGASDIQGERFRSSAKKALSTSQGQKSEKVSETKKRSVKHKRTLSERFKSASTKSKVLIVCFAILFVALLVATALLSWNQWLRYDDKADFQGTWQVEGTQASFVITDSEIQLTSDVAYSYELDTFNKTITFAFGNLTGQGSYAFSPERNTLIISEVDASNEGSTIPSKLVKIANADGSAVADDSANVDGSSNDSNSAITDSTAEQNTPSSESESDQTQDGTTDSVNVLSDEISNSNQVDSSSARDGLLE